jgi:dCMP deaminase
VLVDEHNRIVSTGYNGVACGQQHCTDVPCPGALEPSGSGLDACEAIHAEQNALLFCDVVKVHTAYVTVTPCVSCMKLLLAAPNCARIVAAEFYASAHSNAIEMWRNAGRVLEIAGIDSGITFGPRLHGKGTNAQQVSKFGQMRAKVRAVTGAR